MTVEQQAWFECDCGVAVRLGQRPHGQQVCLVEDGTAFIFDSDEKTVRASSAYALHTCRPQDVRDFRMVLLDHGQSRTVESVDPWESALERDCLKCGATRGTRCWNLLALRRGERVHTRWPHYTRDERPFELLLPEDLD